MNVDYRRAVADDSRAIAEVHVASWQTTYRGIFPDDFLASLSVSDRERMWRGCLENPDCRTHLIVASDEGDVIGFAAYGPTRDDADDCDAEIYALYVLSDHQRKGIGRQLVARAAAAFIDRGNTKMVIWVLKDNAPARAFYEALGGDAVLEKPMEISGTEYAETGYVYKDLAALAKHFTH